MDDTGFPEIGDEEFLEGIELAWAGTGTRVNIYPRLSFNRLIGLADYPWPFIHLVTHPSIAIKCTDQELDMLIKTAKTRLLLRSMSPAERRNIIDFRSARG